MKAVAGSMGYGTATALPKAFKQRYAAAPRDRRRAGPLQHDP